MNNECKGYGRKRSCPNFTRELYSDRKTDLRVEIGTRDLPNMKHCFQPLDRNVRPGGEKMHEEIAERSLM